MNQCHIHNFDSNDLSLQKVIVEQSLASVLRRMYQDGVRRFGEHFIESTPDTGPDCNGRCVVLTVEEASA